jgi:DNA-binding MarR family transcriptional regulator
VVGAAHASSPNGDTEASSTDDLVRAYRQANLAFDLIGQSVDGQPALGRTDLRVLELLVDSGPLTAGDIGRHVGLTTGSVTACIDRLAAARCVRRTSDATDRRRRIVAVTGRGRRCWLRAFAGLRAILGTVASGMDPSETAAVLRFLDRAERVCRSTLAAEGRDARPASVG